MLGIIKSDKLITSPHVCINKCVIQIGKEGKTKEIETNE